VQRQTVTNRSFSLTGIVGRMPSCRADYRRPAVFRVSEWHNWYNIVQRERFSRSPDEQWADSFRASNDFGSRLGPTAPAAPLREVIRSPSAPSSVSM
jgi:hypothetical protein